MTNLGSSLVKSEVVANMSKHLPTMINLFSCNKIDFWPLITFTYIIAFREVTVDKYNKMITRSNRLTSTGWNGVT